MTLAASRQALPSVRLLCLSIAATGSAPLANAAFIEDSSASLTAPHIYLNRDVRKGSGQNKREEWGQRLRLDRTGTDLPSIHHNDRSANEFARYTDENPVIVGYTLPIW